MAEEWRVICEGYEVSNRGRVRSLDRVSHGRRYRGKILKPYALPSGHLYVTVGNQRRYVHHLVAEAYLGPAPEGKPKVLHGPGGVADCSVENLYYGSQSQNMLDRRRDGTDPMLRKTHCPRGHPLEGSNLVPSKLPSRDCLSCSRGQTWLKNNDGTLQEVSDSYYRKLMA